MPTNKNSTLPINLRLAQIRSHIQQLNRSNALLTTKPSLSYPVAPFRLQKQQQNNAMKPPNRTISARVPKTSAPQQPVPTRPDNQYGHFLAYLRRQSLARMRRKQEEEEGNTDHIETTVTLDLTKQSFQSASHCSLTSFTADTSSLPLITITAKRGGRVSSSSQRPRTSYRLNAFQQSPPIKSTKNLFFPPSVLMTPRNSVVDDETMSPVIRPYELHLKDDLLNYCYVSDQSGIQYHRQMLSTAL